MCRQTGPLKKIKYFFKSPGNRSHFPVCSNHYGIVNVLIKYKPFSEEARHARQSEKDPLEIQAPKFENSRLGFIESVHGR